MNDRANPTCRRCGVHTHVTFSREVRHLICPKCDQEYPEPEED